VADAATRERESEASCECGHAKGACPSQQIHRPEAAERADRDHAPAGDRSRDPRSGDEECREVNRRGEREALALQRVGQELVVRTLQSFGGDGDRREEREHRRRAPEGLEDGDVQEHAGERDGDGVRSAAPDE